MKQQSIIWSKMRIQTQILLFSFITSTVVMAILFAIVLVFFQHLTIIFTESQQNIFQETTSKRLEHYMTLQKQIIQLQMNVNSEKMLSIDELFKAIQQEQIIANNQPSDCLDNPLTNDSLAYKHSFCYMYCNKLATPQNSQNLLTLSQVLTETISIFNIQGYYYVGGSSNDGFFTMHNGNNLQGYIAQNRPWYKEHIQQMQNNNPIQYSNPYISMTFQDIYIAQTTNLTYLNQSLAGVISNDISLALFPFALDGYVNTIITNSSGYIMFCKWYNQGLRTIITIANESITGFNETSWTQIKEQAQNPKPILLFYNTQLNQTVYVTVTQLDYPQHYLILYNSTIQQDYDQQKMTIELDNFELSLLQQFGFSVLICFLMSILLILLNISQTLNQQIILLE